MPSFIHPSHIVFIAIIIVGVLFPLQLAELLSAFTAWFTHQFRVAILLCATFFLLICVFLAFSKIGKYRLGAASEEPEFSTLSWLAMLFAAGMGSGLVFYGAAEPVMHYLSPPPFALPHENKTEHALAITFFHWGLHAWSIYAIAALSVAYFTFCKKRPMLPSASITNRKSIAHIINSFAVIAVVMGIVATLSQTLLHLSRGISHQWGLENTLFLKAVILACLYGVYSISSGTGIRKGIKLLSNINMFLAIILLLFVLMAGPSMLIIEELFHGIKEYAGYIVSHSFIAPHEIGTTWFEGWTVTYLLWWVAWAPFVGVFIARISRGRTIREFLCGVIFVPTLFSMVWFVTMGVTAIDGQINGVTDYSQWLGEPQTIAYELFATLPFYGIMSLLVIMVLFVFLVTSADSGTYVLSMFTQNGALKPSVKERHFWGAVIMLATAWAISFEHSGTAFFKAFAVMGGIPYLGIMLWQTYGLWQQLRKDTIR